MSTFRQNLLSELATDLLKVTVANGYNHTITTAYRGFVDLSDSIALPNWFYMLGSEPLKPANEAQTLYECDCDFAIGCNFGVNADPNNTGLLGDEAEKIIADIKGFVHSWYANAFNYSVIQNKDSNKYAQSVNIDAIEPILDYQENKGTILVYAKIKYYE